jgi:hypothetical protein
MKKFLEFFNKTLFFLRTKDLIIIFMIIMNIVLSVNLISAKAKFKKAENRVRNSYCGEVMTSIIIDSWFGK